MPLPVIADTYRVALNWVHTNGQHAVNVMHFYRTSSTAVAVATALDANVASGMWLGVSSGAHVSSIEVTALDGASATYVLGTSGAKWTGSATGDVLVPFSVVVKLSTGNRGRSNRGRVFLPLVGASNITAGVWTTAGLATSQTAWNTFLTAMTTATTFPVVASYKLASQRFVTSFLVEATLGVQRRRQERLR